MVYALPFSVASVCCNSSAVVEGAQGIIFVMDANVPAYPNGVRPWRIDELHLLYILDEYTQNDKPILENVPLLVFANKQDLPDAVDIATIADGMELSKLPTEWHVQPCVAKSGEGLQEGLGWLRARIEARKQAKESVG
jgi:ADP-ribosylation factor 1/2